MDLPGIGRRTSGIHKVRLPCLPPAFSSSSLFTFSSPTPSVVTFASSKMPVSILQLSFTAVLLSLRLANAQSSSSPTSSGTTPSLPTPSVSLNSVNPTAVPLTQIISTEPASPTPTLVSTPTSGSVPTFLPNAPALPARKHPNSKQ